MVAEPFTAASYTYACDWVPEADRFVARAAEWPGLVEMSTTKDDALKAMKAHVAALMETRPPEAWPIPGIIGIPIPLFERLIAVQEGVVRVCTAIQQQRVQDAVRLTADLGRLVGVDVERRIVAP